MLKFDRHLISDWLELLIGFIASNGLIPSHTLKATRNYILCQPNTLISSLLSLSLSPFKFTIYFHSLSYHLISIIIIIIIIIIIKTLKKH